MPVLTVLRYLQLHKLTEFAPLSLAEKWDNVGLLIEPSTPPLISKVLLTNDLTELVMKEALDEKVNLIISYHPPVFAPLKRITQGNWKERIVAQCLENRIALFSPHTSWDAVQGGVNDWLLSTLDASPVEPRAITIVDPADPRVGAGRITDLTALVTLERIIGNLKSNAGLDCVQVARVDESIPLDNTNIGRLALCAGSGGSLLKAIGDDEKVDLFVTGEMSHHEVLDAVHRGTNVILTNHSNSERGFLCQIKEQFTKVLPGVEFIVSQADSDPLKSVHK